MLTETGDAELLNFWGTVDQLIVEVNQRSVIRLIEPAGEHELPSLFSRQPSFGLLHWIRVHCFCMKNITLSADENLIEQARLIAKAQRRTLNAAFREWLEQFTGHSRSAQEFDSLMKRLKHVRAGRRFTRDEMNER